MPESLPPTPEAAKPRRRLRPALAVLAASTLLVVGADMVSFAASGDSVILGKTNKASKTTTIQSTGNGPALKLKTKKSKPPLSVTSKKLVKKLNADMVDGVGSDTLDPKVTRYATGPNFAAMPSTNLFSVPLAAGTYEMSMSGLYAYTGASATYAITCLAIDQAALSASPSPATYDLIWLYSATNQNDDVLVIDASNVVTVPANTTMVFGCIGTDFQALRAADLSVRKVNKITNSTGTPFSPRPGALDRLTNPR